MAKINFENAKDRIGEMVNCFPKTDDGMIIITEAQFDELVSRIMSESTKAFADAIAKQTKKVSGRDYDARISTYKYNFGFFKFTTQNIEERTEETMATEISRDEAANIVNEWNSKIDAFMTQELPKLLEAEGIRVKNGKVSLNSWFKANEIIGKQNFYQRGHEIQMKLRDAGHDVKMNMQDHTLVFPKWW